MGYYIVEDASNGNHVSDGHYLSPGHETAYHCIITYDPRPRIARLCDYEPDIIQPFNQDVLTKYFREHELGNNKVMTSQFKLNVVLPNLGRLKTTSASQDENLKAGFGFLL